MAEEQDAKEGPKASPRFAMAGQIFGRRRTVFAAVPITKIRPNPKQPRQHFDPEGLENLADSIRARGVLQPLIVRLDGNDGFTLIAGERRLRASELAGVTQVPVILSNHDLREVALEENIQRQDLNALEEAEALSCLAMERGFSHSELAEVIHKSRPYVSNTMALNRLTPEIKQEYLEDGAVVSREIMISIARQESPEKMAALWKRVKLGTLSVRSFREESGTRPRTPPVRQVLSSSRKLGRLVRLLGGVEEIEASQAKTLRRSLLRTRRAIDRLLAQMPEEEKPEQEAPRALAAVRN